MTREGDVIVETHVDLAAYRENEMIATPADHRHVGPKWAATCKNFHGLRSS